MELSPSELTDEAKALTLQSNSTGLKTVVPLPSGLGSHSKPTPLLMVVQPPAKTEEKAKWLLLQFATNNVTHGHADCNEEHEGSRPVVAKCRWRTASTTPMPLPTWRSAFGARRQAATCPASV